ncbi:MAG: class I SAM-dependent RNA methyltransferase [Pseudomonadota bacterium]
MAQPQDHGRVLPHQLTEMFAIAAPGQEAELAHEAVSKGFDAEAIQGGVALRGGWDEAWRANLELRGASRILARIAQFRAVHMAQLDKRSRRTDWAALLPPGAAIKVDAACRKSRIYHNKGAAERLDRAIRDALGAVREGPLFGLRLRIEDDLATISLDTSGEPLHRRGAKAWVGKAPIRENLAAMFLAACGYDGREPVVDPMCGSGTFVLEAAEIAADLQPGRARSFAFEHLAGFDAAGFAAMKRDGTQPAFRFFGYDRDPGAVEGATANAARSGVDGWASFAQQTVAELRPPEGPPGLVITNPPYGARIGNRQMLFGLYGKLGQVLSSRFSGWRVGIVTSDGGLAKATGLDLAPGAPVDHSGTSVRLWQSGPL